MPPARRTTSDEEAPGPEAFSQPTRPACET